MQTSKKKKNKTKVAGNKRKVFASSIVIFRLIFNLIFGGAQSASTSSNNVKKAAMHRIFSEESSLIADLHQNDSTQQSELGSKGDQLTIILSSGKISSISRVGTIIHRTDQEASLALVPKLKERLK